MTVLFAYSSWTMLICWTNYGVWNFSLLIFGKFLGKEELCQNLASPIPVKISYIYWTPPHPSSATNKCSILSNFSGSGPGGLTERKEEGLYLKVFVDWVDIWLYIEDNYLKSPTHTKKILNGQHPIAIMSTFYSCCSQICTSFNVPCRYKVQVPGCSL